SGVLGSPLAARPIECRPRSRARYCLFELSPDPALTVITGVAKVSGRREGVSGDSFLMRRLAGGRYLMALGDGMGMGVKAAVESSFALSYLHRFLSMGQDLRAAMASLNSLLLLCFPGESFVSLDALVLDLHGGEAQLAKMGSPPTFLQRACGAGGVEVIGDPGPPLGILEDPALVIHRPTLQIGDRIIAITDGVLEGPPSLESPAAAPEREWRKADHPKLADVLLDLGEKDPQEMAEGVLEFAVRRAGGCHDDTTVLVAEIRRRADAVPDAGPPGLGMAAPGRGMRPSRVRPG
ncbi:MAG: SpoIIE family protein phosphatase, partial [Firmicutes bacterium]|nr:SpoIIE family protein phosphatase [Bacillota bacterium]